MYGGQVTRMFNEEIGANNRESVTFKLGICREIKADNEECGGVLNVRRTSDEDV